MPTAALEPPMQISDHVVRVAAKAVQRDALKYFIENLTDSDAETLARAALEDALAAMWRPISELPQDGNSYLVCDARIADGFQQVVFWDDDDEAVNDWCLATSDGPTFHKDAFTHFMPLPPPPQEVT